MKPQFKILKNKNGKFEVYYIQRHKSLFKKEILKPYVTWSGLDKVYAFSNLDVAIDELQKEIILNTELIKS